MAKHEQILRLMLTAELLKRKPKGITYQETNDYLERSFFEKGLELQFSEKTFKKDRELIAKVLGLKSSFKRSSKLFQVVGEEIETASENVFDNILLIDAYRQTKGNSEIMLFEKRKARGLNHLNGILHAIQNNKIITLNYTKFWDETPEKRVLEPYALKEFKYRWYLLVKERNKESNLIKTFGLDRISDLEISTSSFHKQDYKVEDVFKYSFGIITTYNGKAQEILLKFNSEQGNYIKSLPLHSSQEIIEENNESIIVKVILVPTFDFKQEILSHGENVEVISPQNFRDEIMAELKKTQKLYH